MKKIVATIVVLAAVIVLGSCGGATSASKSETQKLAEKSVKCLQDKDYKGYVDLLYFDEADQADPEKLAQNKEQLTQLLTEKADASAQKGEADKMVTDYAFVSEEVNEDEATVRMAITDGANKTDTTDVKLRKDINGDWKVVMNK
ncbi:MAG: hypothetical protein IJ196_01695 [Prevotella sp.]|nr:hypothetical protein [Prevotella sp.]